MDEKTIRTEIREDNIAIVTLDRVRSRNAMRKCDIVWMVEAFAELDKNKDVRAIILNAAGDHFSAGGDIKDGANESDYEVIRDNLRLYWEPVLAIQKSEKPVIAVTKGYTVGGAMSIVMACDVIFAAESTIFLPIFNKIGLTPEMGMMVTLPEAVGMHKAKELLFSGEAVDAKAACDMGLVNHVCPTETVDDEALKFAQKLLGINPYNLKMTKHIMNTLEYDKLPALMETEAQTPPLATFLMRKYAEKK